VPLVTTGVHGSVMTITLGDESRRNALSQQMMKELLEAIDVAESDARVRVVVVTNRGSVFCAGADLAEVEGHRANSGALVVDLGELLRRIRHSPKPFVARLAGHCVAGGVGLAAVMDVSVAIDSATFGFAEVRVGVAPAIISVVCLAKMRHGEAQEAFLRGNRFSAAEAARLGLINSCVAPSEIDRVIAHVVNDLLAGEPRALAATKELLVRVPAMSEAEAFEWTKKLSTRMFQSDEAREGVDAFLHKRPAAWVERIVPEP